MTELTPQKRGGRIAMTPDERDAFLTEARTCRVGTVDAEGAPHVSALWFVWDGSALWLNSVVKSQRWTNLMRNPKTSVLIDDGVGYMELRGVEILGEVQTIGEIPRTGEPVAELETPEKMFAEKYSNGQRAYDGRHAMLRLVPTKIVSWDFRKMVG